jgi:hypothetical protein
MPSTNHRLREMHTLLRDTLLQVSLGAGVDLRAVEISFRVVDEQPWKVSFPLPKKRGRGIEEVIGTGNTPQEAAQSALGFLNYLQEKGKA